MMTRPVEFTPELTTESGLLNSDSDVCRLLRGPGVIGKMSGSIFSSGKRGGTATLNRISTLVPEIGRGVSLLYGMAAVEEQAKLHKVMVRIDPTYLILVSMVTGGLHGLLMVALDPWLRFPDVPLRVNWQEALFTASIMAGYGAILCWTVVTFWRTRFLFIVTLLLTPILTGVVALWNNINAPFGVQSDLLTFLPFVVVLHITMVLLAVIYLNITRRLAGRRVLAFTAVPVVLGILAFLALGRIRWANQDAQDVITAVNRYASGTVDGDYKVEYLGLRYTGRQAPTGDARIHAAEQTLICRVRLFPNNTDVSCRHEDD